MNDKSRRRFLIGAAGLTTTLSGCSGFIESDQAEAPDVDTPEPTSTSTTETEQSTESADPTEASLDDITVELAYETDTERNMWRLVNESSSMLQMATVSRQILSDIEGVSLQEGRYFTFAVPPGGQRQFKSKGDNNTELISNGSWFENQNQEPTEEADETSSPSGITKLENPSARVPSPGKLDYVIPNQTDIALEDVREAIIDSREEVQIGSEGFRYSSERPLWSSLSEIVVNGTTSSESFTWTASPPPQVDLNVTGSLGNLELTLTSQSTTPVLNSAIYVVGLGPSLNDDDRARATYRDRARVTDDPTTTALITDTVGEERIGESRTVNLPFETDVSFPVEEEEDRLIFGVASLKPSAGFPVASVEVPLVDFV